MNNYCRCGASEGDLREHSGMKNMLHIICEGITVVFALPVLIAHCIRHSYSKFYHCIYLLVSILYYVNNLGNWWLLPIVILCHCILIINCLLH